jgi:hypothetical protein
MVPDPESLLKSCPALCEVHISEITVRGIHGYTIFDQLRRLIVRGPTFYRPGEFVFVPIYPLLTHLAFIHDIPRHFAKNAAETLPNLTHFACSYRVCGMNSETVTFETATMLADELSRLLNNVLRIPLLRVIVVVVQDFSRSHEELISDDEREMQIYSLLKEVPQRCHGKVVFFYLTASENKQKDDMPDPELWDISPNRSFWKRAEDVVNSRLTRSELDRTQNIL